MPWGTTSRGSRSGAARRHDLGDAVGQLAPGVEHEHAQVLGVDGPVVLGGHLGDRRPSPSSTSAGDA